VLQCVAVFCSVLQCVAVCCSDLKWIALLPRNPVSISAVCCSGCVASVAVGCIVALYSFIHFCSVLQ